MPRSHATPMRTSRRQLDTTQAVPGRPMPTGPAGTSYFKGHLLGPLLLLKKLRGSVFARVIPWACLAVPYTVLMRRFFFRYDEGTGQTANQANELLLHPYAYQMILTSTGFTLVFRLNQSLSRYWEARSQAQQCSSKWTDALTMILAFDEDQAGATPDPADMARFGRCILHLLSLMHALAMITLRGDNTLFTVVRRQLQGGKAAPRVPKLRLSSCASWTDCCSPLANNAQFAEANPVESLGGILPAERALLDRSPQNVHMVMGWIMRVLVHRRKCGGLHHDGAHRVALRAYPQPHPGLLSAAALPRPARRSDHQSRLPSVVRREPVLS